jgi:hypothetical protein
MEALKIISLILISLLIGCSSKEVTKEKSDYIFDLDENVQAVDSSLEDSGNKLTVEQITAEKKEEESFYIVQVGAFTTEARAMKFAQRSKDQLKEEIIVSFSDKVNLFVVQLSKKFYNRKDAEIVRDNLRLFPDFQDAWIISINK